MLESPEAAVVGATDPAATAAFLALFDLEVVAETDLDRDAATVLYGLGEPTSLLDLRSDGASRGAVRVVGTPNDPPPRGPFDRGPLVLDVYTSDIEASRDRAEDAGADVGHLGTIELGPLVMRQVMVTGPDGLAVVLVEANHRRPSLLDDDPGRRHSELHSVLWAVERIEDASGFWTAEAGLIEAHVFPVGIPAVCRIMGLPREDHELRMDLLVDAGQTPVRVELFEYSSDPGDDRSTWPLRGGLHALAFVVPDVEAATAELAGARFGAIATTPAGRAVAGVAPGGVRFELWERR